jgi:ketosteroid isomerase-like protein
VPSANLDLVRSLYTAWERGDYSSTEWAHPEIDFEVVGGPAPGAWTGVEAMVEGWLDFLSAWEEFRHEVEEYRELDGERVLVLVRLSGRGKASGLELIEMQATAASLIHVRGGKVTRFVIYLERERALADLGLPAEAGSPRS